RAAARAVDGVGRLAIGALRFDGAAGLRVRRIAGDRILPARNGARLRVTGEPDAARKRLARAVLSVRTCHATAEMIHEAKTCLALKALRFDVDLLLVEAVERLIVLLLRRARITDARGLAPLEEC